MKIIISPSKTLDFDAPAKSEKNTQPKFLDDSKILIDELKKKSPEDLGKMMKISEKLSHLNYERYQNFKTPFNKSNAKQCIFAFKGDVYDGLQAEDFNAKDLEFAQEHLRILSGLYGLLRPLDLMQPYRLEMGTKLQISKVRHAELVSASNKKIPKQVRDDVYKNLYEFWDNKLTNELGNDTIINLASNEYFSAVKPKNVITVDFKENKNGTYKTIGLFAKKARGMMSRYIIKNKITDIEKIKKFTDAGYEFRKDMSDDKTFVFAR